MLINYYFSDWLADMGNFWDYSVSVLPWRLLTFAVVFFALSVIVSLFLCVWRSLFFDIATKDDIIQDRRHCPNSWFFGAEYEKVKLQKGKAIKYMLHANISWHTFWNVAVMGRWRLCGPPLNRMYFHVNDFSNNFLNPFNFLIILFMLYSLAFIWGYPIFLIITLLRMAFCKKPLY